MTNIHNISATWQTEVKRKAWGTIPTADNSTISSDLVAWQGMRSLMEKSVTAGSTFSSTIVSTYSIINVGSPPFWGGVLAFNGDIHFVPSRATVGQKLSTTGV